MKLLRALLLVAVATGLILGVHSATDPVTSPAAMAAPTSPKSTQADETARGTAAAEERRAEEVLSGFASTYRHLEGVTVTVGTTPKGEQAVAYYTDGEIVIDRAHTETIERILAHEIWHVIDWRDNGRLDWGEDLPPNNSSDYFRN